MKLITTALITAKSLFSPIHKNKVNPYFGSKYASLDEILEAISPALLTNNLLLIQPTIVRDNLTVLRTILIHAESGEQLESELTIPPIADPQKLGAAMTYYRRFSICALLAIAPDDDDDGTTAKAATTVKVIPALPTVNASSSDERLLSQTVISARVNREVELRSLMAELNLPSQTVTELVQRHFGIECRIGSMAQSQFERLLSLMRQTATPTSATQHQMSAVIGEKVRV